MLSEENRNMEWKQKSKAICIIEHKYFWNRDVGDYTEQYFWNKENCHILGYKDRTRNGKKKEE